MCKFDEHGGDQRFLNKLTQIAELHSTKQHDYGLGDDPFANIRASQEFGVPPWVGTVIRMNDKVTRIKSFIGKGKVKNESIEDSLLDISVYALIALILFEEQDDALQNKFREKWATFFAKKAMENIDKRLDEEDDRLERETVEQLNSSIDNACCGSHERCQLNL